MYFIIFMQNKHDSNWVPFFKNTYTESETLAIDLMESGEYINYYIGEGLTCSYDFHSVELNKP